MTITAAPPVEIPVPAELASLDSNTGGWLTATKGTHHFRIGAGIVNSTPKLDQPIDHANTSVNNMLRQQSGLAIDTAAAAFNAQDAPANLLKQGRPGIHIAGLAHMILGPIVEGAKAARITQLVNAAIQIAQAVAEASVSWGGSLALIPVIKMICDRVGNGLANIILNAVLGGGDEPQTQAV